MDKGISLKKVVKNFNNRNNVQCIHCQVFYVHVTATLLAPFDLVTRIIISQVHNNIIDIAFSKLLANNLQLLK